MIDYKAIAKTSPIFNGLIEQEKDILLSDGKLRRLNKKEFLFHHGDSLRSFYIICSGTVQLFRTNPEGEEKTLSLLTSPQIICASGIYEKDSCYQYSAVAVTDVEVLEFSKKWLSESVKKYGDFALNLLAITSLKNQMSELESEHRTTMSVTQLLACFFQEMCLMYSFNPKEFELPYSKKLIASRLGIETETLSRNLPKLEEFGIKVTGSRISITSFLDIEKKVCSSCSIEGDCKIHNELKQKKS